ncbi:hypothetical protein RFI_00447 [Reticulomyxa filosa]|uniref:Uncharacterized protein n=1 Tax=Reticulomyxa filosa TaxID=46433 RepID=X6PDN7_RETFI|nr:hypothetical protein RFI_00447 [Reticulomyxa filosa]|eukprot:ETO36615.1 hypothetical protein RFI_00447 [Reticulomyxa filosa]
MLSSPNLFSYRNSLNVSTKKKIKVKKMHLDPFIDHKDYNLNQPFELDFCMPWYVWGIFFICASAVCAIVHLVTINGYNELLKKQHSLTTCETVILYISRTFVYFYFSIRFIMSIFCIVIVIEHYSNWYKDRSSSWVTYVGWATTVLYFPSIKMSGVFPFYFIFFFCAWLGLSLVNAERQLCQDLKDDTLLLVVVGANAGLDAFFFVFTFFSVVGIFIPGFFIFVPQPFTIIGLCLGFWFVVWFFYQMGSCIRNCFCNICFPNTGKGLDQDTYAYLDDTANSFTVLFIIFAIYWTSIVSAMNFITSKHTWPKCYVDTMFGDYCSNGFQLDFQNWKIVLQIFFLNKKKINNNKNKAVSYQRKQKFIHTCNTGDVWTCTTIQIINHLITPTTTQIQRQANKPNLFFFTFLFFLRLGFASFCLMSVLFVCLSLFVTRLFLFVFYLCFWCLKSFSNMSNFLIKMTLFAWNIFFIFHYRTSFHMHSIDFFCSNNIFVPKFLSIL